MITSEQPRSILVHFRRPTFWVTAVGYLLLIIGVRYFLLSPFFRTWAEQNQDGFLRGYFSNQAGYGVVDAVINQVSVDLFLYQLMLAVFVALVLWRSHKAVAMGILAVISVFVVIFLAFVLTFALFVRRGY